MFGAKHIQEESSQTADDAQKTKGSDYPQQQDGLRVHAVIWWKQTDASQSITREMED